jgi:hypothetical protein
MMADDHQQHQNATKTTQMATTTTLTCPTIQMAIGCRGWPDVRVDCRVLVCRTTMGNRVPGLLKKTRARKPAG